jgi:AcrR family transcriptional regulator
MITSSTAPRRRDAAGTRQLLLDAARRRFAGDGYTATTVRMISEDAGVNVSLISRYFRSKEGLFEACLQGAVDELGRTVGKQTPLAQVPEAIARQLAGPDTDRISNQLLLMLRSSGDERADEIRMAVLRGFGERLAASAGWQPGTDDELLLRAQIALAATFGIAMFRSKLAHEPLASAGEAELLGPLTDLIGALLSPR